MISKLPFRVTLSMVVFLPFKTAEQAKYLKVMVTNLIFISGKKNPPDGQNNLFLC